MTRPKPPDPQPLVRKEPSALEFFNERVTSALANQRVEATDEARFYLVSLLHDYLDTERRGATDRTLDEMPLALVLARALSSTLREQIQLLKSLGDRALYVSGFFSDSLARQVVDVDYYVQMGGMAYGRLAGVMKSGARPSAYGELFDELASRFPAFVEVLMEVSEGLALTTNLGLLRLYERWLRTGSRRVAEQLSREGIVPTPVPTRYVQ